AGPEILDLLRGLTKVTGECNVVRKRPKIIAFRQGARGDQCRREHGLGIPGQTKFLKDTIEITKEAQCEPRQSHLPLAENVQASYLALTPEHGAIHASTPVDHAALQG